MSPSVTSSAVGRSRPPDAERALYGSSKRTATICEKSSCWTGRVAFPEQSQAGQAGLDDEGEATSMITNRASGVIGRESFQCLHGRPC